MTGNPPDIPVLDAAHAAFLQRGVAMNVASCDSARAPSLARAYGCRVSPDRRAVTVFLAAAHSQALLRDLRAGAAIAAVFTLPSTHETLQLKGASARVVSLVDGDRALMRAYGRRFADEIRGLGYRDPFVGAVVSPADDEAVGVVFMPTAAFVQTPGPAAGRRLEPAP